MYQIDTHQARTDLYGIGQGEAQVIDLSPSRENAANEQRMNFANKQAKSKLEEDRANDIYGRLGDLDKTSIYAGHRPEFAQKQQELTEYTKKNIGKIRAGDPDAIMGFQDMYSSLRTNAELSKNFREQKEAVALQIAKDPSKYRPESLDYLVSSGRNDDGSISYELDPSKLRQNIDLDDEFRTTVRPMIEDMAKGKSYSYTDSAGNESSVDINNFDKTKAKDLLLDHLKHQDVAEQAMYNFNHLSEEEQKKYNGDYHNYYVDKMLPKALVDQDKIVNKTAQDAPEIEVSTEEKPLTYNFKTQEQTGGTVNGTVPVMARVTHSTPIVATTAFTPSVRTIDGNKMPANVDVVDVKYGETGIVPVYKKGTTSTIDGKKVDIGGNQVSAENIEREKKLGVVEFKTYTNGIATVKNGTNPNTGEDVYQKISITRPSSEIEGALKKGKVPLQKLNAMAEDENKKHTVKVPASPATTKATATAKPVAGKKGEERQVAGGTAIFDGTKWVMKK